jgi:ribonucleoside-diphosphate reductase alpha chain|tara:strand:- start:1509 stop:3278 length:1770 start_codon:yes stop_codon:yes gene_type:complete
MKIDYSKDKLLTEFSMKTLQDRYMIPGESSPQEAFARAATAFSDDEDHAQRLYDYASNLWFMFATPVLSNGGTERGMPISCFLNYVEDSREGITDHYTENAYLSSFGGGIGGSWSDVRSQGTKTSKGSESTGAIPFMKVVDAEMLAFSQGITRRGSYAGYLHISHPEVEEFLDMRKPTGGDTNRKCLNLHHGVVISDKFMETIHRATKEDNFNDDWELIDPHSKEVKKVVSARTLWVKILQNRMETGEPYLMFEDAVNSELPEFQKKKGLYVNHSNLCSEITLATNEERTAVCCLSSVNLEYYDDWKKIPAFIPDLIRMLDNVLEHFIKKAPPQMHRAVYSAMRERSIGLGAMGFHAYLQKNSIPFEGMWANTANIEMFRYIKDHALEETRRLAVERGACPDDDSCEVRNAHLLAIAPNASSSIICGNTSPSIEPFRANAYTQKTKSGSYLQKNKYLDDVLMSKIGHTEVYENTWKSIVANKGSVQHLDMLSEEEKEVFKTAVEINQAWVVEHASNRQPYICQSQSVNLFFPPDVNKGDLHNVHMLAWAKNLKTLYYLRSEAISRADNVSNQVKREIIFEQSDCLSCEG